MKKFKVSIYQLTAIAIVLMALSLFAYDYSNWQYSLNLIINTKGVGVTEDVTNFPLLIRLTPENSAVFNTAKSNGEDIRFSKSDGSTPLPYQIEKWDNISQQATIWVKVDFIYGNNDEQAIIMYYGNSAASSESNDANVFGSIDYSGVWHLNDMDDASRPSGSDYDGTNNGTAYIPGIIGDGVKFEGADWIDISTAAFSGVSSQITMEFWSYGGTGMPKDSRLVWSRDSYGNRTLNVVLPWSDESVTFDAGNSGCYFNRIEKLSTASEYKGTWGHWVFTKDASTGAMRIYYNGALWYSEESGNTYQLHIQNGFRIGADNCGSLNWEGRLDEFRVSKVARSAAWVKLSYESQKVNQTLVGFGSCIGCVRDNLWAYTAAGGIYDITSFEAYKVYTGNSVIGKPVPVGKFDPRTYALEVSGVDYNDDKSLMVTGNSFFNNDVGIGMEPTGEAKLEVSKSIKILDPNQQNNFTTVNNDGIKIWDLNNNQSIELNIAKTGGIQIQSNAGMSYISPTGIQANTITASIINASEDGLLLSGDTKVDGEVFARKVTVTLDPFPDYVFSRSYKLKPLAELEDFIKENGHLPGIPNQEEVKEKGVDLGALQGKLLEKTEEISLYLIELKNENKTLAEKNRALEQKIEALKNK